MVGGQLSVRAQVQNGQFCSGGAQLSPVATELPEIMNVIIWARQGKARLALANISGVMMIQATVPSEPGLLFTPWRLTRRC